MPTDPGHAEHLNLLDDLLGRAKRAGADAADAVALESLSLVAAVRLGEPETVERSEDTDVGLRVFIGKRQAVVSATDLSSSTLDDLAERAVAMAKAVPEDAYCGLADPEQLAAEQPDLDIFDAFEPNSETLVDRARITEDAARAVEGITNSEGARAGWGASVVSMAASNGFHGSYRGSSHSIFAVVVAGEGVGMERDFELSSGVHRSDLDAPDAVGRRAGERTVRRLNPRKVGTEQVPVVYDVRVSGGLLRHLASAINGSAIARGTSFLKDRMGEAICSPGITIIDDPLRKRGLRSRPFDGEGIAPQRRALVEDGVLKSWVMDLGTARQLGLETTGNASRGTSSPPSPATTNLYMEAGEVTREQLIGDVKRGLLVTELMGMGINLVTGDYSRGAAGYWIEDGEIAYPVSELTVAGNLTNMYRAMTPANDLEFRYGVDAPTIRVDGMTVAGQ
ncbi:MAG: TldD/PmbA family protein [Alphaproteobacteria bacterium]|nr:TldD/PmbA family protein [Alphaproteobacteria bacterium]